MPTKHVTIHFQERFFMDALNTKSILLELLSVIYISIGPLNGVYHELNDHLQDKERKVVGKYRWRQVDDGFVLPPG